MESTISKPTVNMEDYVLSVSKGGTGSSSASGAAANLNLVRSATKDMANGVIGLDANGKISTSAFPAPGNKVNVNGLFSVPVTKSVTVEITDYDSNKAYSVGCSTGSLGGTGSTITYTAGSVQGPATITINGRVIPFTVLPPVITPPSILSPVNGATQGTTDMTLTSSAFSTTLGGISHESTDWQMSTNSSFTSVVKQSLANTVNKTSWTAINLTANTTYYIRVRYKGSNGEYSDYGPTSTLTTKPVFNPSTEQAKLSASDKVANDYFGTGVAIDNNGTRVAISARNATVGGTVSAGAVYIFLRTGSSWALEAKVNATDKAANDNLGQSIAMNTDGTRIIVGTQMADVGALETGAAYIFTRTGTTWAQEAKLVASDRLAYDYFGSRVAFDTTATRAIVGVYGSDPGGLSSAGAAYVYSRAGTTWTQEAKLIATDRAANDIFGISVAMNGDGSLVIVGAYAKLNNTGAAYIFTRSGTTWTQVAKLTGSDSVSGDNFGAAVSMSAYAGGAYVAVSASGKASQTGAVYIYGQAGTTWTQEAKLTAAVPSAGDGFGSNLSINYDGNRLIIGAQAADNISPSMLNCGAVYVFTKSGSVWTESAKVLASDKAANDIFGSSLCISGNGSYGIVGAMSAGYTGAAAAGAAYIFN